MYGCNLYLESETEKDAWHRGASMYEPATPASRTPETRSRDQYACLFIRRCRDFLKKKCRKCLKLRKSCPAEEKTGSVGYEFLWQSLRLSAFGPERPALVKPVTRVEPTDPFLAIPRHVAPGTDDPLEHVLFALKHEGTDLQILAEAARKIDAAS
jgi:hypothetical protein